MRWMWSGLLIWLVPRAALAGGYSVDVELLHPTFSEGDVPALDGALAKPTGSVRAGLLYDFASEPVVLYADGVRQGEPVSGRATLFVGASADFAQRVTVRALLPTVTQDGDEDTGLSANGVGMGDLSLGVRALLRNTDPIRVGLSGDFYLPTGTKYAWLGEQKPRVGLGVVSCATAEDMDLMVDLGAMLRANVDTGLDFIDGSALIGSVGVRARFPRAAPYLAARGRVGAGKDSALAGRLSSALLGGVQLGPFGPLRLELGAGKGLSRGPGTPPWFLMAGGRIERWSRPEPQTAPTPTAAVIELPDERPTVTVTHLDAPEPAPEPTWNAGELARVRLETATIEIREPIQFEFGTDRILPVSIPTLHAVAGILEQHPEIEALVIEGHASEEGSYLYNYDLAYRRAGAVFRELVSAGVHPYRLSTRSMGEVVPLSPDTDEASLAANRRVEFHITRQRHPLEVLAPLPPVEEPWNGQALPTPTQAPPAEEPEPAPTPPAEEPTP